MLNRPSEQNTCDIVHAEEAANIGPNGSIQCVVMTNGASWPAKDLLEGLAQRGVHCRVVSNAPAVMVEMARRAVQALIVQEPRRVPRLANLLAAVRRYYPNVICQRYERHEAGGRSSLKPFPADCRDAEPAHHADDAPIADPAKDERDPARHPFRQNTADNLMDWPPPTGPLVTEQELEMLIGDSFDQ